MKGKESADIVCRMSSLLPRLKDLGRSRDFEDPRRKELSANISNHNLAQTELLIAMPCIVRHQVPYMDQIDFD